MKYHHRNMYVFAAWAGGLQHSLNIFTLPNFLNKLPVYTVNAASVTEAAGNSKLEVSLCFSNKHPNPALILNNIAQHSL